MYMKVVTYLIIGLTCIFMGCPGPSKVAGTCETDTDCNDQIECTKNVCNEDLQCEYIPDDSVCDDQNVCTLDTCIGGTGGGCKNEMQPDFVACDDTDEETTPDFCYAGACIGARGADAVAPVNPCRTDWIGNIFKDLQYFQGKYISLADMKMREDHTCTGLGSSSNVFELQEHIMINYGNNIEFSGGALRGSGHVLARSGSTILAVAEDRESHHVIGLVEIENQYVRWHADDGNWLEPALDTVVELGVVKGADGHWEAGESAMSGTQHFWFIGEHTDTPTIEMLVKCVISHPSEDPPSPICSQIRSDTNTTYKAINAYTDGADTGSESYAGVVLPMTGSDIKKINDDGINQDYNPNHARYSASRAIFDSIMGLVDLGDQSLVFGSGSDSLVLCSDPDFNGETQCETITGLPNQKSRFYFEGNQTPKGGIVLLANNCPGVCPINADVEYYLVVLDAGQSIRDGSAWKEYHLTTFPNSTKSGLIPNNIAAGGDSIIIAGKRVLESDQVPYIWIFQAP